MSGVVDRVEFQYNRQGEVIAKRDQNGTIHEMFTMTSVAFCMTASRRSVRVLMILLIFILFIIFC